MYFPSVSIDGDYICEEFGFENYYDLDADDALDRYMDYLNISDFQKPHYIEGLKIDKIEKGKMRSSIKTKYRIVNGISIFIETNGSAQASIEVNGVFGIYVLF